MQNFHVKSILLGIGIGIVLTAFISIIYSAGNKQQMSKEEIIERAKQYGMVFSEELIVDAADQSKENKEEKDKSNTVGNDASKDEQKAAPETKETNAPKGTVGQVKSEGNSSSGTETVKNSETETANNHINEDVVVSILPGYTSEIVAQRLLELGLINDADGFVNDLIAMNLEGDIQVGDFKIKREALMLLLQG